MTTDGFAALARAGAFLSGSLPALTAWCAGLLVVAIVVDRALARRVSAGWRAWLFAAVLVRALLPADLATPVGLLARERAASAGAWSVALAVPAGVEGVLATSTPGAALGSSPRDLAAGAVWLGGVAALLALAALSRVRVSRELRRASPLASHDGVLVHERLGPAVVGVLRPRIVLPRALVEAGDAVAIERVLRHERAHVRRRDPLRALATQAVVALAWPVVPVWLAAWRLRALVEQACDEEALAGRDAGERRAYARTLVEAATWRGSRRLALGLLPFGTSLESRIRALRFAVRWPGLAQAACVVPVAALLVVVAADRVAGEVEQAEEEASAIVPAVVERAIVDGVTVERVESRLRRGKWTHQIHGTAATNLALSQFLRRLEDDPSVEGVALSVVIAISSEGRSQFELLVTLHEHVARVVEATRDARVRRAGAGEALPLATGDVLSPGDEVTAGTGTVVIEFSGGDAERVELRAHAVLRVSLPLRTAAILVDPADAEAKLARARANLSPRGTAELDRDQWVLHLRDEEAFLARLRGILATPVEGERRGVLVEFVVVDVDASFARELGLRDADLAPAAPPRTFAWRGSSAELNERIARAADRGAAIVVSQPGIELTVGQAGEIESGDRERTLRLTAWPRLVGLDLVVDARLAVSGTEAVRVRVPASETPQVFVVGPGEATGRWIVAAMSVSAREGGEADAPGVE